MKRKIAAILAADAAEYSRLVAEDEEGALRQLVAAVSVFRASVDAHGGRIFNTAGDAVLAEFQSAVEAVRSAIDIQNTLNARSQASTPRKRMMFRMGISIGDVVENDGDLLGDGVNIAARLQSLSQPGGLAISKWVHEQIAGKVPAQFRDAGYQHVKNMPAPIHVFHSSSPAAISPGREPRSSAPLSAAARQWRLRALAACAAVLAIGSLVFALTRYDLPSLANWGVSPPSAEQGDPASPPATVARPLPDPSPAPPEQRSATLPPDAGSAPAVEPPPVAASAPPASASPPLAALPASVPPPEGAPPAAPAPNTPIETAAPQPPSASPDARPDAPQRSASPAEPRQGERPLETPAPVATHKESAPDPKRQKVRCAEVLERAQLGDLTSDDQAFLRSKCR